MKNELQKKLNEKGRIVINLKIKPAASQSEWAGSLDNGTVKINLKAQAEDGKANQELLKFLAKEFAVRENSVKILKGKISRNKLVAVSK